MRKFLDYEREPGVLKSPSFGAKIVRKYPVLGSSVNPEQLSLTIKGILLGIIPFLAIINSWFGINIEEEGLRGLAESIPAMIAGLWTAWSLVMVVWGGIRKIINNSR